MTESLGRAVLELVADLNPLKAQLAEGEAATEKMAASSARSFKSGIHKALIPAVLVLGAVALGMHKAVDAAEADQAQTARLSQAYKTAGLDLNNYSGSIADAVTKGANLGFQSADTKAAMGSLIVATHDHAKALRLLGIAQDIARFKGVSLTAATKMLTLAQTGSQRAIKQLGLTLPPITKAENKVKLAYKDHTTEVYKNALAQAKAIDKAKTTAAVTELVSKKLHGQAAAYADTGQGIKDKMGAQVNLLGISLGKMLLPAIEAVVGVLSTLTGWLQKHSMVAKIAIGVIAGVAAAVLLVNTALRLQAVYTRLATAAQWLFNTAMDASPVMLVVLALAALGLAFVIAWKKSATFRAIVLGAWHAVEHGVRAVLGFFTKTIPHAFITVLNWVKGHWPEIAVFISGPFAPLVALATNAFGVRSALVGAFKAVWGFAKGLWDGLGKVWGAAWNGAWGIVKGVINSMIGGINWLIGAWDSLKFHFPGVFGIGAFDVSVPHIDKIPLLAAGGIVSKPTLAIIGEKGPEAVVPLGGGHGGLGQEVNIVVNGVVGNPREVAVTIGRELQKLKARGVDFALA